jgi:hypothetical protein
MISTNAFLETIKKNLAVALTLLSAISYYLTFQYEKGICDFYHIPTSYIEIGITNILVLASLLLSGMALIYVFIKLIYIDIASGINHKLFAGLVRNFCLVLLVIGISFLITGELYYIVASTIFGFATGTIDYLLKAKQTNKVEQDARRAILEKSPNIKRDLLEKIIREKFDSQAAATKKVDLNGYIIVMVVALIPFLIYRIGFYTAKMETSYKILADHHEMVLLKKYNDIFIFRELKNHRLGDKLSLIKHSPQYPMIFKDSTMVVPEN